MGLDMYSYAIKNKNQPDEVKIEIAYWRKFNALHGWMEKLFIEKGGLGTFNCEKLFLTKDDLTALEATARNKELQYTPGFFFGNKGPDDDDYAAVLDFVSNARRYLLDGYEVYYDSWW
jgi:hypothetical protein